MTILPEGKAAGAAAQSQSCVDAPLKAQHTAELGLQKLVSPDQTKDCDNPAVSILYDQTDRVAAKEAAVQDALNGLRAIRTKFQDLDGKHREFDLESWSSLLAKIEDDDQKFEYLTGVAGDTGMGKTTLLNALVGGGEDLAPVSQNGACTAAVCCFHQHPDPPDPATLYLAKVQFKSKEVVDQELITFFQEYKEKWDDSGLDGNLDVEIRDERKRMQQQLDTIRCWSGLEQSRILELGLDEQAPEITLQCVNGTKFFEYKKPHQNKHLTIGRPTAREFQHAIKPYVGDTNRRGAQLLSPLVEIAHIFVRAPLLRNGIVLVDLPGERDALDSRSQVARKYYNKLNRLMVVTPCDRAADNHTAAELLRDDQVMDLEADGKIDDDCLCVVATKIDQMEWYDYAVNEEGVDAISDGFPQLLEDWEEKKAQLRQLGDEIRVSNGRYDHQQTSILNRRKQGLELEKMDLEAQCLRACIDFRSQAFTKVLRDDFDQHRRDLLNKKGSNNSHTLSVFPVSSRAQRSFMRGEPEPAFPNAAATGFSDLENWIIQGSLPEREQHADGILVRCQRLFDAAEGWAIDQWHVKLHLPEAERPRIKEAIENLKGTFLEDVKRLETNLKNYIKKHEAPSKHTHAGLNTKSIEGFVDHIKSYGTSASAAGGKMHWSTYAACVRRFGDLYKSTSGGKKTYYWMGKTYSYYWTPHIVHWGSTYNQKLLDYMKKFGRNHQDVVDAHVSRLSKSATLPEEYKDALKLYVYKVENIAQDYRISTQQAINSFRHATRDIRLKSKDLISQPLRPGYNDARAQTGKGKNTRQVKAMNLHAEDIRKELFDKAANAIVGMLNSARKALSKKLQQQRDKFTHNVIRVEHSIAKQVCSTGENTKKKAVSTTAILGLKDSIKHDIEVWTYKYSVLQKRLPIIKFDPVRDNLDIKEDEPETTGKRKRIIKNEYSDDEVPLAKIPKKAMATAANNTAPKTARKAKAPATRKKPGPKPATKPPAKTSEAPGQSSAESAASAQ